MDERLLLPSTSPELDPTYLKLIYNQIWLDLEKEQGSNYQLSFSGAHLAKPSPHPA